MVTTTEEAGQTSLLREIRIKQEMLWLVSRITRTMGSSIWSNMWQMKIRHWLVSSITRTMGQSEPICDRDENKDFICDRDDDDDDDNNNNNNNNNNNDIDENKAVIWERLLKLLLLLLLHAMKISNK